MAIQQPPDRFLEGQQTFAKIGEVIDRLVFDTKVHKRPFYITFGIAFMGVMLLLTTITWLLYQGVGIWGNNIPVGWAWDIVNFVVWIGIGHAGTLISAILLLMRQKWRNSINRFAEAMTIFAVMCAALYPVLHMGRPWNAYWLMPYPNIMALWPQFRSPLVWDVFAVSTYFTVSLLFWYMGLVPDMATLRDRATNKYVRIAYAIASLGWRGSAKHWHRYEQANLLLAGLSTPLVLSVHTIVSYDFAMSIVPGWQVTIFPPYFVAGAVFAGFAMVLMLGLPLRAWYGLKDIITMKHIDWMAKIMMTTGMIVFYGYITEILYGLYGGSKPEMQLTWYRFTGPYAPLYWMLICCNGLMPMFMWSKKLRAHLPTVWFVALTSNIGMWLERFVIIPMSLTKNPLPAMNKMYYPTIWDICMFLGTIGFFIFMMGLFIRALPSINMFEVKDTFAEMLGANKKREASAAQVGGE